MFDRSGKLEKFTDQQLYNELWDRSGGNVVLFTDEDVKRYWEEETGRFPTADEVQCVWAHIGEELFDRMCEAGVGVLKGAIEEVGR